VSFFDVEGHFGQHGIILQQGNAAGKGGGVYG
jgi:hypothetical protein